MAYTKNPTGNRRLGDMHEKGTAPRVKKKDALPSRWWTLDESEIPGALSGMIRYIQQQQTSFEQQRQVCARLYGGQVPGSAYGVNASRLHSVSPSLTGRLTYNIESIVIDALQAKICKDNLSVQFVTQGGDYRQQRRAKKLSQFADGITYETKMDSKGADAFRDGAVLNEGPILTYQDWRTGRAVSERVIPSELYVDEVDGLYGQPTQMHRARLIDKEILLESEWAKSDKKVARAIRDCHTQAPDELGGSSTQIGDMIAFGESWRLPSGVDSESGEVSDDGRHVVFIPGCVLNPPEQREWKKLRFPFSIYRWKKALYGWHGISLAQDLIGSQVEANHLLIMFQRAFRMMAAFRIAVETGTVPDQHFQDKIGTILHIPKGAQIPQFLTPPALNEQYFRYLDGIKARAFEIARLSQMSAVGQKPAGLDSGEAQRTYHDIENEGFTVAAKEYEDFRLDVVTQQIDCVRDIFSREKSYKLRAPVSSATLPGQRFLRSIDWKNVKLEEDEYILRGYSTSSLPSTPAGKLATVNDMLRAQLIDPETGRKLLNFPDLAQVQSFLGAAEDWIMSCLDDIVENGKPRRPDQYMLLPMAERLGIQEYALGAANGMEGEKLNLLRTWISRVQVLKQTAQAGQLQQMQQVAAAQAGGLPPGSGVGAPAPVSSMLPPPGSQAAA